ncbi:hypothetical protein [Providencia manganoxydans]|uniref:hypothetical protein n=1 Tax=Providencia manganoxydans TaxID=2923283 RepID=UPI0029C006C6|nr:hypothetical protein [Providencia manganoxydans]MDX4943958.1 hypothetical protein [Providencia manganoxydans]
MNNKILELAKELKEECLEYIEEETTQITIAPEHLVALCSEIERSTKINAESTKLIEAFCADDVEWHKLLDAREQENSTLINLVVKLADKYSEVQKELNRINTLSPIGYIDSLSTQDLKCGVTALLFVRKTEPNQIPLYRLDK